MAQDQRSQRKKPRDKLWLWITPPVYDNNQQRWQITVSATLSAGPNTSGAVLKFFADGREFARRKTDQSGSAGAECLLGVGRHEIEVVFTTTQQLVRVEIAPQVHLDLTDSSETIGNGFCVTASAYVSLAGAPVVGIPVLFFCDEEQYQEPQQTDTDGRAGMAFLNLREGRHIFSALLQGSTIRARQSLTAQQQREITLTLSRPLPCFKPMRMVVRLCTLAH
ncbi:MAG: hypothetical protein HYU35_00170 [Parcubacteria group bacterium]|nr:hypothetical protein [Parcubacteria group bacterium]